MILLNEQKLIESKFENEQEVEDLVIANSEHFFGPSSIFIPKAKIKTKDGAGTIPDGFAVDVASRTWYIVEAELAHHSVWNHISPQVTKQILAANQPSTKLLLAELVIQMLSAELSVREKFADEGIEEIDIRKVLDEILSNPPIIGIPIDGVSNDLREWAKTLKYDVKLWVVKKFTQFKDPSVVAYEIPEEYRPDFDTAEKQPGGDTGIKSYDVTLEDLIAAELLQQGQELFLNYKPRGGEQQTYTGTLGEDGSITVLGQAYASLSYAALACIQDAGSNRTTVNGWTSWKTGDGKLLADVRTSYLSQN